MIRKDTPWEIANLGVTSCEFSVGETDVFIDCTPALAGEEAEYAVVKVPSDKADFLFGLPGLSYSFVETQFSISKAMASFDYSDRLVRKMSESFSFVPVENGDAGQAVLDSITPGMFSTDRIHLDPLFGPEAGRIRYVNWIRSVMDVPDSVFFEFVRKGTRYGFALCRVQPGDVWDYLLGGVYEPYLNHGLGLLTPAAPFLYAKAAGVPLKRVETSISSNNLPVVKLYQYLGYRLETLRYVYVRQKRRQ